MRSRPTKGMGCTVLASAGPVANGFLRVNTISWVECPRVGIKKYCEVNWCLKNRGSAGTRAFVVTFPPLKMSFKKVRIFDQILPKTHDGFLDKNLLIVGNDIFW